jgi:biotin carboxylase
MKKKLLIVNPGSELKEFFFRELSLLKINYFIIVMDAYPKFIHKYCPKSKCLYTSSYRSTDILNTIIRYSHQNHISFDGILTFNEDNVFDTAQTAEYLGLPSVSSISALHSSYNKFLMREACKKSNIRMPRFEIFSGFHEGIKKMKNFSGPVVIKPFDRASSEGVMKIENPNNEKAIKKIFNEICCTLNVPTETNTLFLIEEYISGIVTSIDGIVQNNKLFTVSISDFLMEFEPNFFQTSCFIPSNLSMSAKNLLIKETKKIIRTLNFNNCSFHCEFRIHNSKPYLLEIAARCGGGYVAMQIKEAYNINYVKLLTQVAFGEKINPHIKETNRYTSNFRLSCNGSGIINQISGFDKLHSMDGIKEYVQFLHNNDYVPSKNMFAIAGFFLSATSRRELVGLMKQIKESISYSFKPKNIIVHLARKCISKVLRKVFYLINPNGIESI